MEPLKSLFSMCRSPRYGFRASEPSLVVRSHHTSGEESSAVGDCHGHSKPDVSLASNFLHLPEPDEELLSVVGEKMVAAARASGQPITLVVMQVYDLPEVELVFGRSAAEEVIDEVMTQLTRMAARKGFVVRSKADTFALLIPGMNAQATMAALGARFGRPCAIEFELGEDEILLVPDVKVHTLDAGESLREVYTRVGRLIARERGREQLRCEYLRSEREAHTPIGLSCARPEPREKVYYPVLPATIPVPMGAR